MEIQLGGVVQIGVGIKRERESWSFESAGAITSSSSRCKFHWDWLSIVSPFSVSSSSLLLSIIRCPSLKCLSFFGCTYTIKIDREYEEHSVSSPSFAFFCGKLIPVRPFAASSTVPAFFFFFLWQWVPPDRSNRWPFVLIREISSELRIKKGKWKKEGCGRGCQPAVNSQSKYRLRC